MKNFLKIFLITFLYVAPANAACDFMINIGDKGGKLFEKFGPALPDFPGSFLHRIVSIDICPNDNLNEAIVVEYMFLGENESEDNAILAGIKMYVLNDEENSESKKLTLMNYAKKVYGDFDTGQNPQIYNNYNIWEKNNTLVIYNRYFDEDERIHEELFITNNEYDKKLGEFYNKIEEEQIKAMLGKE